MMDAALPHITEVRHVHGMQIQGLPGFYNSSCGPFTATTCVSQLNLWCVNGFCQCFEGFAPDESGGCKGDIPALLVMMVARFFLCAFIFIICLSCFHIIVSKRCWCRRTSGRGGADGEAEEGRRGSRDSCWDDEPPQYLEVAEEGPPPTYLEAVAKERMCNGAATRGDKDGTQPQPATQR